MDVMVKVFYPMLLEGGRSVRRESYQGAEVESSSSGCSIPPGTASHRLNKEMRFRGRSVGSGSALLKAAMGATLVSMLTVTVLLLPPKQAKKFASC